MTVILSNSNLPHVSATTVIIMRVMRTRIQLQLRCRNSCIVAVTNMKMAAWVARTCRCLLYNKITLIHSSAFFGIYLKKLYLINTRNMEHKKN